MATIKSYTDLEQSRKLAEFLPIESADMTYCAVVEGARDKTTIRGWEIVTGTKKWKVSVNTIKNNYFSHRNEYIVPCWSLSALLDILDYPQLSKDKLGSGKVGWMVSVYPNDCRYDSCWHDNPVDACYELILKLNELKIL